LKVPSSRSKVVCLSTFRGTAKSSTSQKLIDRSRSVESSAKVGPGSYFCEKVSPSRQTTINCSERNTEMTPKIESPSPDSYSIEFVDSRIGRKIGERREISKEIEVTEIGVVNVSKISEVPHSVFQRSIERIPFGVDYEKVPGPGTYESRIERMKLPPRDLGIGFGSRTALSREMAKTVSPGPIYDLQNPPIERTSVGTFHFRSKSVPSDRIESTPIDVGPGRYDFCESGIISRNSPPFASHSTRILFPENDFPGPTDYNPERKELKQIVVHGMRHPIIGDWALSSTNEGPSPEKYSINRDLISHGHQFPKASIESNRPKEIVGPGSYDLTTSFIKKSYNSGVPRSVRVI
jgi:hypothetical protein